VITFQQDSFKQEIGKFILRSINLFILHGIRKNYLSLLISRVIKQIIGIIKAYHCYQIHKTFDHTFCPV